MPHTATQRQQSTIGVESPTDRADRIAYEIASSQLLRRQLVTALRRMEQEDGPLVDGGVALSSVGISDDEGDDFEGGNDEEARFSAVGRDGGHGGASSDEFTDAGVLSRHTGTT